MHKKKTALFLLVVGLSGLCFSQESKIYTYPQKDYDDALTLYNEKQYQAAQAIFERVQNTTEDLETEANSAYYAANAAVRLNQLGADKLMENFVRDYPTSSKRNSAFIDVADYYFENGKYPYAIKWYGKVDQSSMSYKEKERFNFQMGYSLFSAKKSKEAERYLSRVSNSETYGSQAKYYLGYIAYQQDDYEGANERFDQIQDQEVLNDKLSYYQADMNFKLGRFEDAIVLAKAQLPKSDRKEVSELNKIIGESYFNLEQYANAIPYLEEYKGKRGRWSNTDYYLLGYCYYKMEDYANAIGQFNKIIDGNNGVSQNAYYHLAECYLKLDKKQEALNAFRNASTMEFVPEIQEDAFLNYARLSYEIGNPYELVPVVLNSYLKTYPNSTYKDEVQELLVDSYLTSKDFEGALKLLENNSGYASKETYQKVAFYRGVEVFMEAKYAEANALFDKSLKNAPNAYFKGRARFWKAESLYLLNDYTAALENYKTFKSYSSAASTAEFEDIDYNLAYASFKLKDYENAIFFFKSFLLTSEDSEKKNDANVRLGDCYFVSSKYWPAIESYDKVISSSSSEKDYAAFQKALSYGFIDRNSTKLEELNNFNAAYPRSGLRDDVLFEMGNSYIKDNQETSGLESYDQLIQQFPMSSLVPQALLRQGLVHYNANRNEEALSKFKTVVRDFPQTQEAVQAVATAKLIYVDMGNVNEYAAWVAGLDFVEVTDSELDNASFESAQKQQQEGKTEAAIKAYEGYIQNFPSGMHRIDANFNLAQLYFTKEERLKALPKYKVVAQGGASEYSEQALTRVCEIYVTEKNYAEALPFLVELENTANISQNRTFAQSNLMKGYYEQKEYDQTITYANKVLQNASIDDRIKSDAQIMIARSAIATNNESAAQEAYKEVLSIASGSLAAEALFYKAYFERKEGSLEASNTSVQRLARDYSSYKEWGGKGLVIMAKNFNDLDDAYQATYILESVISNFSDFPAIVAEAKEELAIIKNKEAERNSSIQPEGN